MRSKRLSILVPCLLIAIVLVFVFLHAHHRHERVADETPPSPTVAVVAAHVGTIANQLSVAGVFQPFQDVDVHGKVSGYIRHIYVDIGDRVHEGQTLAVLEVPELDAEVAGAQAGITQARQNMERQQNEVARQEASYAATRDRSAAAQVDAAKSAVAAAQGQLGVSRANNLRVSSLGQYATITAPFSGEVTMRYADTGSLIPAGTSENDAQAVVRLAQSDVLRLRMPIPEQDVPLVHVGSMVTIHVQATGQQFPGSVIRFSRDVSNATRTMLAEVDVPNSDLTLTPGMYADVTFALQQKTGALIVPSSAIIQGDEPSVMLVDSSNRVQGRSVVLGIAAANEQEITGGLSEGDRVIIGELSTLQPGEKVTPQDASPDLVTYHQQTHKGDK